MRCVSYSDLTPDQRLTQMAIILARGVLRHKRLARLCESPPEKEIARFSPGGLEVPGNPRLSVSRRIGT